MESSLIYDNEPLGAWSPDDFESFALWCIRQKGISDIHFIAGDRVWVRRFGFWATVTQRVVSAHSIFGIVDTISRDISSSSHIQGSRYIDFVYLLRKDRYAHYRFRCNVTGCRDMNGSNSGVSLVVRIIPDQPPSLEDLQIEQDLIDICTPNNGLVLITGVMGEGKTTLLSAILKRIRETQARYICTVEDPVEFDLVNIPHARGPITQSEIGKHLLTFADAPRNTARRAVDVLFVGESRDTETLKGMLIAAEMGMAVYTTVHTRSVSETFSRIISVFPSNEWNYINTLLVNSVRLVVQQRLLKSTNGERIAIREYLALNTEHREQLHKTPIDQQPLLLKHFVETDGVSLLHAAQKKLQEQRISQAVFDVIEKEVL